MHHRRSRACGNARTTAGEVPPADCRGQKVSKRYLVVLLLSGSALAAHADTAIKPGHAAIASAHKLATAAGFETLAAGGNAFDAAVTVAATLSVVEPQSSGIGGGGLFLLHRVGDGKKDKDVNDKDVMVDARETAPAAVDAK